MVNISCKDWSLRLIDALQTYRTAYKKSQWNATFQDLYVKTCHLCVKLEHRAYWAIKRLNFNLNKVELDETRNNSYACAKSYKDQMK